MIRAKNTRESFLGRDNSGALLIYPPMRLHRVPYPRFSPNPRRAESPVSMFGGRGICVGRASAGVGTHVEAAIGTLAPIGLLPG